MCKTPPPRQVRSYIYTNWEIMQNKCSWQLGGSRFVQHCTRELKRGNDQVQNNNSTSTPAHTAQQIKTTSESRQEEGVSKTKQERICTLPSRPYNSSFSCGAVPSGTALLFTARDGWNYQTGSFLYFNTSRVQLCCSETKYWTLLSLFWYV